MIIVTGVLTAKADCVDQMLQLSLEHVRRSRTEDGCISHDVSVDGENPDRLLFVERWRDMDSLMVHFALDASKGFVKSLAPLVSAAPEMKIYDATEVPR